MFLWHFVLMSDSATPINCRGNAQPDTSAGCFFNFKDGVRMFLSLVLWCILCKAFGFAWITRKFWQMSEIWFSLDWSWVEMWFQFSWGFGNCNEKVESNCVNSLLNVPTASSHYNWFCLIFKQRVLKDAGFYILWECFRNTSW